MNNFKTMLSVIVTIAVCTGATIGALSYFAKAEDLDGLRAEYYLDKKVQRKWALQDRIWSMEAAYPHGMPAGVLKVYQQLIKDLQKLEEEIERDSRKKGA